MVSPSCTTLPINICLNKIYYAEYFDDFSDQLEKTLYTEFYLLLVKILLEINRLFR